MSILCKRAEYILFIKSVRWCYVKRHTHNTLFLLVTLIMESVFAQGLVSIACWWHKIRKQCLHTFAQTIEICMEYLLLTPNIFRLSIYSHQIQFPSNKTFRVQMQNRFVYMDILLFLIRRGRYMRLCWLCVNRMHDSFICKYKEIKSVSEKERESCLALTISILNERMK